MRILITSFYIGVDDMLVEDLTLIQLCYILGTLLLGGGFLTLTRRWGNKEDSEAGYGVAGWTMFLVIVILNKYFGLF